MNLKNTIKKILIEEVILLSEKHKVSSEEYLELYRDQDFVLVIPFTHNASRKYGSDAKWCTTKRDCDKDFKDHLRTGVLGYIVIRNYQYKERLNSNAFAIYRNFGDNLSRTIVFDDMNTEYRNGEAWLSNKFDRVDKLYQFYLMMQKYNEYFEERASQQNTNKESKQNIKESKSVIDKIESMINDFGYVKTIKLIGGYSVYDKIKKLNKFDKINLIKKIVKEVSPQWKMIDLYDYNINIKIGEDGEYTLFMRDIFDVGSLITYNSYKNLTNDNYEDFDHGYMDFNEIDESLIDELINELFEKL